MARRPKRSLTDELTHHAAVAAAVRDGAGALELLQPDIAEFAMARRMLDAGLTVLWERRNAAAVPPPQPASLVGALTPPEDAE